MGCQSSNNHVPRRRGIESTLRLCVSYNFLADHSNQRQKIMMHCPLKIIRLSKNIILFVIFPQLYYVCLTFHSKPYSLYVAHAQLPLPNSR